MQIRGIAGRDFCPKRSRANRIPSLSIRPSSTRFSPAATRSGRYSNRSAAISIPFARQIVVVEGPVHYNRPQEPDRPTIYTPLRDASRATLNVRAGDLARCDRLAARAD